MSELYIKVVNGEPELRPYTLEQVKNIIYRTASMILPAQLTDKLIAEFDYYPVELKLQSSVPDKLAKYTTNELKRIYEESGVWYIDMQAVVNNHLLLQDWEFIRRERNKLLLETDWVQFSDSVTEETKKRFYAYREILRDIVRVAEYPCDVKFPQKPSMEYIDSIEAKRDKETREQLSEEDSELLKNYETDPGVENQKWYKFLVEWSKLEFILDKAIVSNLILAYTDTTLENIVGHD